jgi:hypothetical protein
MSQPLSEEQKRQLDRIQALLAKAEMTDSEFESEALSERALELAARFQLENALAERVSGSDKTKSGKPEVRTGKVQRPFVQLMQLANEVYGFCGCTLVRVGKENYTVVGYSSDLDRAHMLLTSILVQGVRRVTYDYREFSTESEERRSTYKRSWWQHFNVALHGRLKKVSEAASREYDKAAAASPGDSIPGAALVLAERKDAVQKRLGEIFPQLRKGRRTRATSGSGGSAGYRAGNEVDLGEGKIGVSRKALEK